jgi:hypothetical protein
LYTYPTFLAVIVATMAFFLADDLFCSSTDYQATGKETLTLERTSNPADHLHAAGPLPRSGVSYGAPSTIHR